MTLIVQDNGTLKIPKDLFVNDSGTIKRVRELWVNDNGTLRYIYGGNLTNYTGNHPYWTRSLNSDFDEQDGSVPCWNSFWSSNNAGQYTIDTANSRVTVTIPVSSGVLTEVVPPTAGYYEYSSESKSILTNTTAGDRFNIITKNTDDLLPLERTDVQTNLAVRWNISSTWTQADTRVQSITNATTFVVNRQPLSTTNGSTSNLSRTWASNYVPPTTGYTRYYGWCTLQSNYELRISENTTYTITVSVVGGVTNNTTWKMGCLTGNTDGGAQFFSAGSQAFESVTRTNTSGQYSFSFTSPSGAIRARPYIRIDYDTGTSDTPSSTNRQFAFDFVRFA